MLDKIRKSWSVLDELEPAKFKNIRLVSHENYESCPDINVKYIAPGYLVRITSLFSPLSSLFYSIQLLFATKKNHLLIVNGAAGKLWIIIGLLNSLPFIGRKPILCWDVFPEVDNKWKKTMLSKAVNGLTLCVVWSKVQVRTFANWFNTSENKFVFLPFKANHSKGERYENIVDNYIFSGGNSKRDYKCIYNAVKGTNIPVIISTTDSKVQKDLEFLPNVIVISAKEPAFAQLQSAARFVIFAIATKLRGAAEANYCNAMWHGKPVISADSVSACDYIIDGVTGYVVSSGDYESLRDRILDLWNNSQKSKNMGQAARKHAELYFSHKKFIRRLLLLALCVGAASNSE